MILRRLKYFEKSLKKLETKYLGHEIIAIDEVSFRLATTYKRIWFPRGETPRGAFFWSSKKLITFAALTSNHKFYYDFYESQNSLTFMHFLRELFKTLDENKKYVLILNLCLIKSTIILRVLKRVKKQAKRINTKLGLLA